MSQPDTEAAATRGLVDRFNDATNRHDAAAVAALLTEDTVFENPGAGPWHLRGVDHFTVRDGRVASKLAYVKG